MDMDMARQFEEHSKPPLTCIGKLCASLRPKSCRCISPGLLRLGEVAVCHVYTDVRYKIMSLSFSLLRTCSATATAPAPTACHHPHWTFLSSFGLTSPHLLSATYSSAICRTFLVCVCHVYTAVLDLALCENGWQEVYVPGSVLVVDETMVGQQKLTSPCSPTS
jgi:hypothetical protein